MEGTYIFGEFSNNRQELDRLELQAKIASDLERKIFQEFNLMHGMNVLDMGCGPGLTSLILADLVKPGRVTGADANPLLLQRAKENRDRNAVANVEFVEQNVYHLQLSNNFYDFAYARLLFQHLAQPVTAMRSILPTLKPGGKLCIADVDDQFLALYPGNERFDQICEKAKACQAKGGGDRLVGRKLVSYLEEAGFENIRIRMELITSRQLGLSNFIGITTRFKAEQISADIMTQAELALALNELDNLPESTLGMVGVFIASGDKPHGA